MAVKIMLSTGEGPAKGCREKRRILGSGEVLTVLPSPKGRPWRGFILLKKKGEKKKKVVN